MVFDPPAAGQRTRRIVGGCRFGAPDLHALAGCADCQRRAGQQAAAADRRDQGIQRFDLIQQFQRAAALAGDDAVVVVGRNGLEAQRDQLGQASFSSGLIGTAEAHLAAVLADRLDLAANGIRRHHDMRWQSPLARGAGQGCPMIAR